MDIDSISFKIKRLAKNNYLKLLGVPSPLSLSTQISNFPSEIKAVSLPTTYKYIVINFDDLSPVESGVNQIGFGGLNDPIWSYYDYLLSIHPEIGITHFLVPEFTIKENEKRDYLITRKKNSKWLSAVKEYALKYNTEFAIHGLYHKQFRVKLFSRHTEFAFTRYDESLQLIKTAKSIFESAGINFKGFRPPGWDINSDFSLINALIETEFEYCALNSYDGGLNSRIHRASNICPTIIGNKIINFPDNILLDWSLEKMLKVSDEIIKAGGFLSIKGHFAIKELPNSLSKENCDKLVRFLSLLKSKYLGTLKFVTFKNLLEEIRSNA